MTTFNRKLFRPRQSYSSSLFQPQKPYSPALTTPKNQLGGQQNRGLFSGLFSRNRQQVKPQAQHQQSIGPVRPTVQTGPMNTQPQLPTQQPLVTQPAPTFSTSRAIPRSQQLPVGRPIVPTSQNIQPDNTFAGQQQEPAPTQPSTPQVPQVSDDAVKALQEATKVYQQSLQIGPEELSTQKDLDRLSDATRKAYTGIEDKTIPLEFITGQLASTERRALALAEPLESKLSRLQAKRLASVEASKFGFDEAQKRVESEQERIDKAAETLNTPLTFEQSQQLGVPFGTTVGQAQQMGITPQNERGDFTLSDKQTRYVFNTQTGQYETIGGASAQDQFASGVSPQQQRALDQSRVARSTLDDIFNNPFVKKGAVARGIGRVIPGSSAKDLRESVKTVQALIGFDELQDMRDASPTGGALGQVSEREIDFLQALGGSINLSQSNEQLTKNLQRIQEAFDTLYLVNAPDGTSSTISGVEFTKMGDKLITQAPDGVYYMRRPDGDLDRIDQTSFNQASSIGSVDEALEKIGSIESGGNYQAMGPTISKGQYKGQRAIGKYQVMAGNIPEWSKLALGYSVTPQQFRDNPKIQDAVARDQFMRNYQKYGNWNDVASVWFTGRTLARAGGAKDQLGTSAKEYVRRFNAA